MRTLRRLTTSFVAVVALTIVATGAAVAGNWAEAVVVPADGDPATAGGAEEVRVTLLQHGVTPVESGTLEIVAWLPATGTRLTAEATSVGDGEWRARLVFPTEGDWQLRVRHSSFGTPEAVPFAVAPASGVAWLPPAAAMVGVAALSLALVAMARLLARPRGLRTEALGAPHNG